MKRKPGTPYRLSFVVRTDEDASTLLDMLEEFADSLVEELEPIEYETERFDVITTPSTREGVMVEVLEIETKQKETTEEIPIKVSWEEYVYAMLSKWDMLENEGKEIAREGMLGMSRLLDAYERQENA